MDQTTCCGCGGELSPQRYRGNPRRWCSEACRVAAWHRKKKAQGEWTGYSPRSAVFFLTCSECGELFCGRTSRAATCGTACRRFRSARIERERYVADPATARQRQAEARANWTLDLVLKNRERGQRRRAKVYGAAAETFTNRQVFDRDEWTCGICLAPIDQTLRFPDPDSASLDHIVPLSLGGSHTLANSRASHLHCNCSRGNRVEAMEEVA